jgi:streptomycin 6-kinase
VALGDVAAGLHDAAWPGDVAADFPRVEDWARGFARHRASDSAAIPVALLDDAQRVYEALATSQGARRLLHGDLHHDNVLWDDARGWVAIDPKGIVGEPAFEGGALVRNPGGDTSLFATSAIVDRRVRLFAERVGAEPERVTGWAFALAVLSAVWSCEDGDTPAAALRVAGATRPLL